MGKLGVAEAVPEILKLLQDMESPVRGSAARSLGRLGAKEAAPELPKLLKEEGYRIRVSAAEALCRLESQEGVAVLLEEKRGLVYLNAVRAPAAWRLMEARTAIQGVDGSTRALVRLMAKEAGLSVEGPMGMDGTKEEWGQEDHRIWNWNGSMSRLEVLESTLSENYEVILEEDRIRILRREEALIFWKEWWAKERKKK